MQIKGGNRITKASGRGGELFVRLTGSQEQTSEVLPNPPPPHVAKRETSELV